MNKNRFEIVTLKTKRAYITKLSSLSSKHSLINSESHHTGLDAPELVIFENEVESDIFLKINEKYGKLSISQKKNGNKTLPKSITCSLGWGRQNKFPILNYWGGSFDMTNICLAGWIQKHINLENVRYLEFSIKIMVVLDNDLNILVFRSCVG